MGPRLSLWGCLRLHLGEFPSCLKVSPAQLFFLQKHSEPRRLLRRQPPLHRPRHLLLPFPSWECREGWPGGYLGAGQRDGTLTANLQTLSGPLTSGGCCLLRWVPPRRLLASPDGAS
ncbi:unnamed protein product [Rangifer tarandus platyrhynchus]|uniref:Uncharacterized protein n=2 Tax=Rangifer tarandus platyrhynchus TaxID=3082113 RepID=A0ABN8Z9Y1_RANTA|nr:unnamed protein product [Rangifer tarandus platyrhynchus]CAI9689038.1 unnamed protein product [Rangifer tarandus platyrhynchus]